MRFLEGELTFLMVGKGKVIWAYDAEIQTKRIFYLLFSVELKQFGAEKEGHQSGEGVSFDKTSQLHKPRHCDKLPPRDVGCQVQ